MSMPGIAVDYLKLRGRGRGEPVPLADGACRAALDFQRPLHAGLSLPRQVGEIWEAPGLVHAEDHRDAVSLCPRRRPMRR